VVEFLPSKYKVLTSNPSIAKKKKKKERERDTPVTYFLQIGPIS
jgi:hypothetical protein